MDAATRRNPEITQNLAGGMEKYAGVGSDSTVTPMGSRMLKRWLHMPIRNTETLTGRQQTIAALQDRYTEFSRCCVRWVILSVSPAAWPCAPLRVHAISPVCGAFQQLPELRAQLGEIDSAPVQSCAKPWANFTELRELLERAIIDAPPVLVRDGGVIAPGYNEELDEWRALADGATDYLDKLEIRERERLGSPTP